MNIINKNIARAYLASHYHEIKEDLYKQIPENLKKVHVQQNQVESLNKAHV